MYQYQQICGVFFLLSRPQEALYTSINSTFFTWHYMYMYFYSLVNAGWAHTTIKSGYRRGRRSQVHIHTHLVTVDYYTLKY